MLRRPTGFADQPLHNNVIVWLVQIPLLFYAAHGSFSLFSLNGAMAVGGSTVVDTDSEAGSARMVIWASTLIAVLLMFPLATSAARILYRNRLVAAFLLLAASSTLWSQDPTKTLQKFFYLVVTTCFGLYLAERFQPQQLMRIFMVTGWIAAICSLFLAVALPDYGIFTGRADATSGWQGIYSHKNTLGLMTVYFLPLALFLPIRGTADKLLRLLFVAVSLIDIAMSRSRGSWIMCSAFFAFACVMKFGRRMNNISRLATYCSLGLFLTLAGAVCWALLPVILGALNKDVTLTGRTVIWSVLLSSLAKQPWFGFGYGAFWVGTQGESANAIYALHWPRLSYAENGVLELALELGIAGVVIYLLAYLQIYRRLRQLLNATNGQPELFWYASILFLAAITNIEAGYIAGSNSMEWLLFVLMASNVETATQALTAEQEYVSQVHVHGYLAGSNAMY